MLVAGKIQDQMGPNNDPAFWAAAVSATTPYDTMAQSLRLAWGMTGIVTAPGGAVVAAGNVALYSMLGTLNWSWYKVSANQFMIE